MKQDQQSTFLEINREAKKWIPSHQEFCSRLLELVDELTSSTTYSDKDNFHFMALCYLAMQRTHLNSILKLEASRDAILIARPMLEKMCLLVWVSEDVQSRGSLWREFVWIIDWRRLRVKKDAGELIDPEQNRTVEKMVNRVGDKFLTSKARKAKGDGKPMPTDPYFRAWHGKTFKEIAVLVDADDLYKQIYRPFSDWMHGDVAGIAFAIEETEDGNIKYSQYQPSYTITALNVGFQSLIQTLEIVVSELKLNGFDKITDLRTKFVRELGTDSESVIPH